MKKICLLLALLLLTASASYAQNTYAGGIRGSVTANCVPKSNGQNSISTTVICSDGTTTSIGANKVTITEASGNTAIAGTLGVSAATTVTSASANALAVGLAGATNPAFNVDSSTASQAAGLNVTGAATGGTVAIATIDSGSATNLTINAKGTGTIGIGSVSTGVVTITPATTVTGNLTVGASKVVVTASSGNTTVAGTLVVTGSMNGPMGATVSTTTPVAPTAAQSGQLFVSNSTADAVQVFTLPVASTAGGIYCFALGSSSLGSNREIDVEPTGASDLIIGTTTPAGGTGVVTTAGPGHGMKNTHATAVRGNSICLQSDGVNTWYQRALVGIWAGY